MVWRNPSHNVSLPRNLMTPKTVGRFTEWSTEVIVKDQAFSFKFPVITEGPFSKQEMVSKI